MKKFTDPEVVSLVVDELEVGTIGSQNSVSFPVPMSLEFVRKDGPTQVILIKSEQTDINSTQFGKEANELCSGLEKIVKEGLSGMDGCACQEEAAKEAIEKIRELLEEVDCRDSNFYLEGPTVKKFVNLSTSTVDDVEKSWKNCSKPLVGV